MEAISASLKATAWLSLGATYAAAQYIDRIKPNVVKAANKMRELSEDLESAIASYRDGDNNRLPPVLLVYFQDARHRESNEFAACSTRCFAERQNQVRRRRIRAFRECSALQARIPCLE